MGRIKNSSLARGLGEGLELPPLACRPKGKIWKIPRFSTSETAFCAGIDSKNFKNCVDFAIAAHIRTAAPA